MVAHKYTLGGINAAGDVNRLGFGNDDVVSGSNERIGLCSASLQIVYLYYLQRNLGPLDWRRGRFLPRFWTHDRLGVQNLDRTGRAFGESTRRRHHFIQSYL